MKRIAQLFLLILMLILVVSQPLFAGGWMFYTDGPYRGKVVDLETGAPIEGAVVAGVWHIGQYGGPGGAIDTFCDAKEALTDKKGEFEVPRAACAHWWPLSTLDRPKITIFKPGYLGYPPLGYTFEERKARMPGFTGQEFRDKKQYHIIKLGRPKTKEEREFTNHFAISTFTPEDESYEKMPNLLRLVNEERKNLGFVGDLGPVKK